MNFLADFFISVAIAGVITLVSTILYAVVESISNSVSSSSSSASSTPPDYPDEKVKSILKDIPNSIKNADRDRVDIKKFSKKLKNNQGWKADNGWTIQKDTAGHSGSEWKLFDKGGKRIASLRGDGTIVKG